MGLRPAAASFRLLLIVSSNCSYRCNDASLISPLAVLLVFVIVAGIAGFYVAAATPGTCCVVSLFSVFVANVVGDIAAAPLAAVVFAVGASLDAVAGSSLLYFCIFCCAVTVDIIFLIILIIICVVFVLVNSGLPKLW